MRRFPSALFVFPARESVRLPPRAANPDTPGMPWSQALDCASGSRCRTFGSSPLGGAASQQLRRGSRPRGVPRNVTDFRPRLPLREECSNGQYPAAEPGEQLVDEVVTDRTVAHEPDSYGLVARVPEERDPRPAAGVVSGLVETPQYTARCSASSQRRDMSWKSPMEMCRSSPPTAPSLRRHRCPDLSGSCDALVGA